MKIIICGSKKHELHGLDNIIDKFDVVVRNNMLLHENGYGKRLANIQVMNAHVYDFYTQGIPLQKWQEIYCTEYGSKPEHMERFYNFITTTKETKFVCYNNNNTELLIQILHKNDINIKINKQIRCGLSHVAQCIHNGEKPFLVGFSITPEENMAHNVNLNKKTASSGYHETNSEIEIIKELHEKGLVDASLCALTSTNPIKFSDQIQATNETLDILSCI
jgi:hypothetical protein